jgi:hypothetical protein
VCHGNAIYIRVSVRGFVVQREGNFSEILGPTRKRKLFSRIWVSFETAFNTKRLKAHTTGL